MKDSIEQTITTKNDVGKLGHEGRLGRSPERFLVAFLRWGGENMCEANVDLKKDEQEELLMEQVDIIEPFERGLRLVDIVGKQKMINARIKDMNLINHRIVLEELKKTQDV